MKKLLLMGALILGSPVSAGEAEVQKFFSENFTASRDFAGKYCLFEAQIAENFLEANQKGITAREMMDTAQTAEHRRLLKMAYAHPRYRNWRARAQAKTMFRNWAYLDCMERQQ